MSGAGWKTAAEVMAALRSDPAWVARESEGERVREELERTLARAERPIVSALNHEGITVRSVWDLVNTSQAYPRAIPILVEHLQKPYPPRVRQSVARALAVREARDHAFDAVVSALNSENDPTVLQGLFVAISGMATPSDLDVVIGLAKRVELGPGRIFLTTNLRRSRRPAARAALLELQSDPQIGEEVRRMMRVRRQ